jgi:hypothetical protein
MFIDVSVCEFELIHNTLGIGRERHRGEGY